MSKLIAVTPYGPDGASSRVRVLDWLRFLDTPAEVHNYVGLASNSVRSLTKHPVAAARAEVGLRGLAWRVGSSNLILSKQASPLSNGTIEATLLSKAAHSAYDFDDAIMYENPRALGHAFNRARTWRSAVRASDVVIAGNEFLGEIATKERPCGDIRVIPSCVDPAQYIPKSSYDLETNPVAVWLGSPSTEAYLETISPALADAHKQCGLRIRIISAGDRALPIPPAMVDRVRWHPGIEKDVARYGDFGIMPLVDSNFARGKCAYKLLQYSAAGLPSIASPVGANVNAAEQLAALTAKSHAEWVEAIRFLTSMTPQERAQIGHAARVGVIRHYSFSRWLPEWTAAVGKS